MNTLQEFLRNFEGVHFNRVDGDTIHGYKSFKYHGNVRVKVVLFKELGTTKEELKNLPVKLRLRGQFEGGMPRGWEAETNVENSTIAKWFLTTRALALANWEAEQKRGGIASRVNQ